MYSFKLLIEQKYPVELILDEYRHEILEHKPHLEVRFFVDTYTEMESHYWNITKKFKAYGIKYVMAENLELPV